MTVYKPWYITKMLSSSITSANVSNNKIIFKYMFGSNDTIDEKYYSGLTNDLINTISIDDKVNISSMDDTDGTLTITSVFTNSDVTKEHKLNTIGIVAEYNGKEFLAAISSANTPYLMPVYSDNERVEYTIRAQLGVSNTSVVDLSLDPVSLATNETVIKIKDETDRKISDNSTRVNKAQTSADNAQKRADDSWDRTDDLYKNKADKSNTLNIRAGSMGDEADYNDFIEPGIYQNFRNTPKNAPNSDVTWTNLIVLQNAGNGVTQIIIGPITGIFVRFLSGAQVGWGPWMKIL